MQIVSICPKMQHNVLIINSVAQYFVETVPVVLAASWLPWAVRGKKILISETTCENMTALFLFYDLKPLA